MKPHNFDFTKPTIDTYPVMRFCKDCGKYVGEETTCDSERKSK